MMNEKIDKEMRCAQRREKKEKRRKERKRERREREREEERIFDESLRFSVVTGFYRLVAISLCVGCPQLKLKIITIISNH